jgi:hypothetical protein
LYICQEPKKGGLFVFGSNYPRVKQSLAQGALRDTQPALIIDRRGVVQAANLMAFWLWDKLPHDAPFDPGVLLGKSIYMAVAGSLDRVPLARNVESYSKVSAIVRRLNAEPGADPTLYEAFIAAMRAEPNRAYLFEHCALYPIHEGEYALQIILPGDDDPNRLLAFNVTAYRLDHDQGFLVTYNLLPTTYVAIEEHFARLISLYSTNVYTLPASGKPLAPQAGQLDVARPYYPMLVQDPLWYNVRENNAMRLLAGGSVVGIHFFDMFFSPQMREWMGPLHETSSPRAVKYFDRFTAPFTREDHDLHDEYARTMRHLLQVPGFREAQALSRKAPFVLRFPEQPGDHFYACRVFLPWLLAPTFTMQFRNIVRYLYDESFAQEDRRHYQLVLIPENYDTEVALILLHLMPHPLSQASERSTVLSQYLWLLGFLTTIQEGLGSEGEDRKLWEPGPAFARIHSELAAAYPRSTGVAIGKVIARIRAMIDAIHAADLVDKQTLLLLLHSVISAQPGLERLAHFLTGEQAAVAAAFMTPESPH